MLLRIGIIFFLLRILVFSQDSIKTLIGEITFISSENYYVKFEEDINSLKSGDTLFVKDNNNYTPSILIKFVSKRSFAGSKIGNKELKLGDKIVARINLNLENSLTNNKSDYENKDTLIQINDTQTVVEKEKKEQLNRTYYGYLSAQSYSNYSNGNTYNNFQQWRYSLAFSSNNYLLKDLYTQANLSFSYQANQWQQVKSNLFSNIKIYNLSLNYRKNNFSFILGRTYNSHAYSIGILDGIQSEFNLSNYSMGFVVGSRPNNNDYGYDFKLFEYGVYAGRSDTINDNYRMQNFIGVYQQTNNFKTDRRFLSVQHESFLDNKFYFLISSEFDLYERKNGTEKNTFNFVSAYVITRYSFSNNFSINLSYDARKNLIFYETFKNFADSLFDRETRQGLRLYTNIKITEKVFINLNSGINFQSNDDKKSYNLGTSLTYISIPLIGINATANYNYLSSSYNTANLIGLRLNKDLFEGKIYTGLDINKNLFRFTGSSNTTLDQTIISASISFYLIKSFYLSTVYEGTFESNNSYNRLLVDFSARF